MIVQRPLKILARASAITIAFTLTAPAVADSKEDAAAAYDRGAAAYDRGDYVTAANDLARADELAPSPVTLELAIYAAVRADEPELAMTLVERAEKRKGNKSLDAVAQNAKKKLGSKVGKLNVVCPASAARCVVAVDGTHFEPGEPRWVAIGPHKVSVTTSRASSTPESFDVKIESGKTIELVASAGAPPPPATSAPPPPPPPPPADKKSDPPASSSSGISPTWFWVSLGVTAAAGGGAIVSGLDTKSKHDAFRADPTNQAAADAGQSAETRTIILIAATGVFAAVTAALGIVLVDWKGGSSSSSSSSSAPAAKIQRRNGALLRLTSTGLVF